MSSPESHDDSGELSSEERALLAEWQARSPPAGFAEAVLAQMGASTRTGARAHARWWLVPAAAALAAALALAIVARPRSTISGELRADERTTVDLGGRATAVAEPGAHVAWRVSGDGHAQLEQTEGAVFYRVEHGPAFEIHTPQGTVRVVGTCFWVEVSEMKVRDAALASAGGSALVTALVTVSVLEGRVVAASPKGEVTLAAGQSAQLAPSGVGRVPNQRTPSPPARRRGEGPLAEAPKDGASPALGGTVAGLSDLPLPARLEVARLEAKVAELETELKKQKGQARRSRTYDLSQEELEHLASTCTLAWDMPPLAAEPHQLNPKDVEELALTREDEARVNEALRKHHRSMRVELERLYTEATGDANVGSLSMEAMIAEIEDKTPRPQLQAIFQRLAKERAGVQQPEPQDKQSTTERLMRLLTSAGDRMESSLAESLDPKMAHAIRDLHEGFGSRSQSSVGCPKGN